LTRSTACEALKAEALRLGASRVFLVRGSQVVVDERVRLKCLVPLCPNYGRHLLCPPNLPPLDQVERALRRYERAVIVIVETEADSERSGEEAGSLKLHHIVNQLERKALSLGLALSMGLIGGSCRLCEECVGSFERGPCRHPYEARPSMEGMGIDVTSILKEVGVQLHFPPRERVIWTGMVLLG